MKLSEINDEKLNDEEIENIVYSNVADDGLSSKYALVFGNSMLIQERVSKAVEIYKQKRAQKLIFMGGINGVSNQEHSEIAEAEKMKTLAIKEGVKEEDIIVDNLSNNTFENIDNAMQLIGEELPSNILLVTSEFHLKRCYAILKQKQPSLNITCVAAKDGFSDKENWYLSDNSWNSGRSLVTYEAHLLVKYAKENKIADLEIDFGKRK